MRLPSIPQGSKVVLLYKVEKCLDHSFYERNTEEVARSLIGKVIVRKISRNGQRVRLASYIIETEAYGHHDDPASHAFKGLRPRNSGMFGDVGRLYVYFVYGKHTCANITARECSVEAGAVLIRSILPLSGVEVMDTFRKHSSILIIGPGRVAKALAISMAHNGLDITSERSEISIRRGLDIKDVTASRRIGISKGVEKPWRFTVGKSLDLWKNAYNSRGMFVGL